jgi:hypothetical protein
MTDFMKRIAKSQANSNSLPEYDAWMMIKNGRRFTLRWRLIPLGDQKVPGPAVLLERSFPEKLRHSRRQDRHHELVPQEPTGDLTSGVGFG